MYSTNLTTQSVKELGCRLKDQKSPFFYERGKHFSHFHRAQTGTLAYPILYPVGSEAIFPGINGRRDANHSLSSGSAAYCNI
jgi:hypothetical protein